MSSIRTLFSTRRAIDRRIEKVIDYSAVEDARLLAEIEEYEVTDNVEACFRKFLEHYQSGVESGQVTEIGVWVSGFYGSGKSSYTKYLGLALDPEKKVGDHFFIDLLSERFRSASVQAMLRTVAKKSPTAVVFLDLGAEQLTESAAAPVSTVLYWKVLQWAGYSREKKLAQLEFADGDFAGTRAHLLGALDVTEQVRGLVAGEQQRTKYMGGRQDLYRFAVRTFLEMQDNAAALETWERAHARSLLDTVGTSRSLTQPAASRRESDLSAELNFWSTRLADLAGRGEQTAEPRKRLEQLFAELRQLEPQFTGPEGRAIRVQEIQKQLLDAGSILCTFFLDDSKSVLWTVTPNSLSVIPLGPKAVIERAARRV